MRWWGAIRFDSLDDAIEKIKTPIVNGKRVRPVVNASAPVSCWKKTGNMKTAPARARFSTSLESVPRAKFLFLNSLISVSGRSSLLITLFSLK